MINSRQAATAVLQSARVGNPVADFMLNGVDDILSAIDADQVTLDLVASMSAIFGHFSAKAEPATFDGIVALIDGFVARLDQSSASRLLAEHASRLAFRYDASADPAGQLRALLDATINDRLVIASIDGLKACLAQGRITQYDCRNVAGLLGKYGNGAAVNTTYAEAIERSLLQLAHRRPGEPLYLVSIGCGRGNNDVELYRNITVRNPHLDLKIVGFDAHQQVANNPIVTECGGWLFNRELRPGETYLDVIREHAGTDTVAAVATERYALHHMHRTVETLLADIEDIALVSVDHPISGRQLTSLAERTAMIAYDLLSAQIRTAGFGGGWIPAAMADPSVFRILYRREADLVAGSGITASAVPEKTPPTWILSYPAGWRTRTQVGARSAA